MNPKVVFDKSGYVRNVEDNILPGIDGSDFERDYRKGDGNELKKKIRAIHSSSALVVNCFGRFKQLPFIHGLTQSLDFTFEFEGKCSIGFDPSKHSNRDVAANLDLLAVSRSNVVAVESKCTEYFTRGKNSFSPAYFDEIGDQDSRRSGSWFAEMVRLSQAPKFYATLHAAQLIKHAFGLANHFSRRPAVLYYLYWEPTNADQIELCLTHRKEIADFALRVEGGNPAFRALSYDNLWNVWEQLDEPRWLETHVTLLRRRYGVAIEIR
jgi:hypothetical protein